MTDSRGFLEALNTFLSTDKSPFTVTFIERIFFLFRQSQNLHIWSDSDSRSDSRVLPTRPVETDAALALAEGAEQDGVVADLRVVVDVGTGLVVGYHLSADQI